MREISISEKLNSILKEISAISDELNEKKTKHFAQSKHEESYKIMEIVATLSSFSTQLHQLKTEWNKLAKQIEKEDLSQQDQNLHQRPETPWPIKRDLPVSLYRVLKVYKYMVFENLLFDDAVIETAREDGLKTRGAVRQACTNKIGLKRMQFIEMLVEPESLSACLLEHYPEYDMQIKEIIPFDQTIAEKKRNKNNKRETDTANNKKRFSIRTKKTTSFNS